MTASQNTYTKRSRRDNHSLPRKRTKTIPFTGKQSTAAPEKRIMAADMESKTSSKPAPTGKGWCGRKNGEHHQTYYLHLVNHDLDFGEEKKKGVA